MTEEKLKKIVTASTISAVLLLFILICVLIYQVVALSIANDKKRQLEQEIVSLQQSIDNYENDYDYYLSQSYLEDAAREYGYKYSGDKD